MACLPAWKDMAAAVVVMGLEKEVGWSASSAMGPAFQEMQWCIFNSKLDTSENVIT